MRGAPRPFSRCACPKPDSLLTAQIAPPTLVCDGVGSGLSALSHLLAKPPTSRSSLCAVVSSQRYRLALFQCLVFVLHPISLSINTAVRPLHCLFGRRDVAIAHSLVSGVTRFD